MSIKISPVAAVGNIGKFGRNLKALALCAVAASTTPVIAQTVKSDSNKNEIEPVYTENDTLPIQQVKDGKSFNTSILGQSLTFFDGHNLEIAGVNVVKDFNNNFTVGGVAYTGYDFTTNKTCVGGSIVASYLYSQQELNRVKASAELYAETLQEKENHNYKVTVTPIKLDSQLGKWSVGVNPRYALNINNGVLKPAAEVVFQIGRAITNGVDAFSAVYWGTSEDGCKGNSRFDLGVKFKPQKRKQLIKGSHK
ncbi:MAG: hypothetical protein MJ237_05780 [bacterium]|nr:hypothetical protein [bacterium]